MILRLSLLFLALSVTGVVVAQPVSSVKTNKITLSNPAVFALTDKGISIKRGQLKSIPRGNFYPLILSAKGDTILAQADDLNAVGDWDEIFFVVNLPAKSSQSFLLKWVAKQPAYVVRTSVRFGKRMSTNEPLKPALSETAYALDMPRHMGFQRYQTDGPSWENDKVGFRHYLDGRNAKDVFGKLTPAISPETVGINAVGAVEDNYHVMEPWGRDVLAVQNSIGIGGVALLKRDSILRLGVTVEDTLNNVEKTEFNIITEGPVRSSMKFKYHNWNPAGRNYDGEEITSIVPGMYAYHNAVKFSKLQGDEKLLIGMVSIFATKPPELVRVNSKWVALLSHEKHSYNQQWWLPLALILPADAYLGFIEAPKTGQLSNSYLAKLKLRNNQPVHYYAVAGWELSDAGFKEAAYFKKYVIGLVKQISAEVKMSIQ